MKKKEREEENGMGFSNMKSKVTRRDLSLFISTISALIKQTARQNYSRMGERKSR